MYQLERILSFIYCRTFSGRAEIGRQARLRGVWVSRESSSLSDRTKKGTYD